VNSIIPYSASARGGVRPARCGGGAGALRPGMTLFEIMFAVLIIFLVMGLLIGAIRMVTASAQDTAHRTAVLSLRQSISQFQTEFGFAPPLVRDVISSTGLGSVPTVVNTGNPVEAEAGQWVVRIFSPARHGNFLRFWSPTWPPTQGDVDLRFSIYSLPFYLVGVLDEPRTTAVATSAPIDGAPGPGFRKPRSDGQFESAGRRYDPFFAVGSGSTSLYTTDVAAGRIELRDRSGTAFRYYRWERATGALPSLPASPTPAQLDVYRAYFAVPRMVGDPVDQESLRSATFAVVGAGPNGIFGDEALLPNGHPQRLLWTDIARRLNMTISGNNPPDDEKLRIIAKAMEDNIVEVGQ
jgi:type II secretory pathway pseudopilin PulG